MLPDQGGVPEKVISLHADRHTLAKRRWRAMAEDRTDFGFDVSHPLSHGDIIYYAGTTAYRIAQKPEPVLEVPLPNDPGMAASIGWLIGNLHFGLETFEGFVRVANDPAIAQMLERESIPYRQVEAVFIPLTTQGHHSHGPHEH